MELRIRPLLVGTLLALLIGGCGGGDDTTDAAPANIDESTSDTQGDATSDGTPPGAEGTPGASCPEETSLGATTETTYEGDVEVLAAGTAFPSAHFTLDLDGSGYGPILSGVLSTDPDEDVEARTHTNLEQPQGDVRRVEVLLEGPAEGATEFPLGVYDVTFADGKVDATEGMGLAQLDIQDGESSKQARSFTELELTHIGDGVICGEFRPVDRSDETSQAPTYVEGSFVADYSERP